MKTLYIIGNGFDLFHNLKTKYQHFALFLLKKNPDLFALMVKYYWLTDLDPDDEATSLRDELWGDFENKLSEMDLEELLDDFTNYLPDYGSDEFRSGDYHTFDQEISRMIDRLTTELYAVFKEFILQVEFDESPSGLIALEPNSLYLSFNYTDTLELYYGIERKQITYIHGRALTDGEATILGHGIDPEEFMDKPPVAPTGLSEEELQQWTDEQSDQYDYAYNTGRDTATGYFRISHKSTAELIEKHSQFFSSLKDVQKVFVLGHSISPVDQPYFLEVIKSVDPGTEWKVSYYGGSEMAERMETMVHLGVTEAHLEMITIDNLKVRQKELF